jgi:uncharacterized RDD family membrane protein YckC
MSTAVEPFAAVQRRLQRAGFWRRAGAFATDGVWLFCVLATFGWLLFGVPWLPAPVEAGAIEVAALLWHQGVPALVCVLGWALFGATPGKFLLELRVVDAETGERPRLRRAALRYLGYFVAAAPLGLGFVWIAWDPCKQGLHDKLAGTEVIIVTDEVMPGVAL